MEAKSRLAKFGPNALPQAKQRTTFEILLSQFSGLIVLLLIAATAIALAMGNHVRAVAILVVIILNTAIGICREAGIRTVMITGDQQSSAAEIATQLGMDVDDNGNLSRTFHGGELVDLELEGDLLRASTMAFMTLALSQVFHDFIVRSLTRSVFTDASLPMIGYNEHLQFVCCFNS